MKNIILFIIFCLFILHANAQHWQWTKTLIAEGAGYYLEKDNSGHIYLAGILETSIAIVGQDTLLNANGIYLIKMDTAGNYIWARSFGGYNQTISGLTIDKNGSAYISSLFTIP